MDEHAYDTVSGSDWLCDQDAVEAFVQEAPRELLQLEHWGCPWSRQPNGRIAVRAFGGMKNMRTWFAADKTGFHMLHTLFQTSLKYADVKRYDEWFVTRLLVDDGRVHGVVAIELMTGRIEAITAKSVVLCTGGCGKVFPFTTNANICTGDGMALAYRAGAPLKDMEFVQYHPTGLPFTGILITEATRAEGGWLLNKDGYRYLQDYDLGTPEPTPVLRSMELGPRDRLSQAFVHEVEKGRTIESPYGPIVHLDLRHLGAKLIDTKLPMVRELCLKYERIDPVKELIPVRPVVHYMMGGVAHRHQRRDAHRGAVRGRGDRLREHQRGEPAGLQLVAGVPGLRRPSRQGRRGVRRRRQAATTRRDAPGRRRGTADRSDAVGRPAAPSRIADIREAMQSTMEDSAGIFRSGDSLAKGIDQLAELQQRLEHVQLSDETRAFNTELVAASGAGEHARHRRNHPALRAATRGVARRPPADRLHRPRRHALPRPRPGLPRLGRIRQDRAVAGDDHPMATRRAGLRKVARLADSIQMQVTRYAPGTPRPPSPSTTCR